MKLTVLLQVSKHNKSTRMHSSRMHTGRTLTVFQKLETPQKFTANTPLKNLEHTPPSGKFGADTPPKLEQTPPRKFGASPQNLEHTPPEI